MLRRSPQPSGQRQSIQHGGISRGNMATPKAHSLQNWISEDTFFEETTWKETKKPCKLYGLTYDWHLFSMNFNSHIMIIGLISHGHGDGFSWIYSLTGWFPMNGCSWCFFFYPKHVATCPTRSKCKHVITYIHIYAYIYTYICIHIYIYIIYIMHINI